MITTNGYMKEYSREWQWAMAAISDRNRFLEIKKDLLQELKNKYLTQNLKNQIESEIKLVENAIAEIQNRIDWTLNNSYIPPGPYKPLQIEIKSL